MNTNTVSAQHTPEYSRRGAQSGFWHCRCSCGWSYPGAFATTKRTVREAHVRHVAAAKPSKTERNAYFAEWESNVAKATGGAATIGG